MKGFGSESIGVVKTSSKPKKLKQIEAIIKTFVAIVCMVLIQFVLQKISKYSINIV